MPVCVELREPVWLLVCVWLAVPVCELVALPVCVGDTVLVALNVLGVQATVAAKAPLLAESGRLR